jgi:TRAP-type uncharacterized transport system substrate-binding protein
MKKKIPTLVAQYLFFSKYKWLLLFSITFALIIYSAISYYPKTTLTMAVHTSWLEFLDKDGQVKAEYNYDNNYQLQKILKESGVKLIFKAQENNEHEKSQLEFLVTHQDELDFTSYLNLGNRLPIQAGNELNSIGIYGVTPYFFIIKSNKSNIRLLKDLKGKKIAFWTSPEGSEKPVFTKGGDKASPYSDDIILEQLFKLAGVTADNSDLINVWPGKLSMTQDWDIFISQVAIPSSENSQFHKDLYPALLKGEIKYLEFEDIQAIPKLYPHFKVVNLPKSVLSTTDSIPKESLNTIAATKSYFIKKDLDSSLVMILTEAIQKIYSKPRILAQKDEFPNFSSIENFPASPIAEKFYREGGNDSFLNHYFSPTFAAFIKKLLFILAPVFLIAYPILHFSPQILRIYGKYRIANWYKEIYQIEDSLEKAIPEIYSSIELRLSELEKNLRDFKAPLIHSQFVQEIFIVREHIDMIRKKLHKK